MPVDIPSRMASASCSWKRPIPVSGRSSEEPGEMDVDPIQPGTPLIFTHTTTRPQPSLAPQLTSFRWESQPSNATHAPTVHRKPLPKSPQTHAARSPHPTRCDPAIPPRHTRLPRAFMPTTHRFTPYMRIMTSPPPPISLTVRQREPTRNERRIRGDQVSTSASTNIVTCTPSLASFVTSLKTSSKALSGQSSSTSPDTGDSRSSYTGPSTPNAPTDEPPCDFLVEAESPVSKSDVQVDTKSKQ